MCARKVDLSLRFHAKYSIADSGCWLWTGAKDCDGYGGIQVDGEKVRAHRVSWELAYGSIPCGLWILHKCDTPSCVNPDHLFMGTHAENVADKVKKSRQSAGISHGRSKLSEADVIAIRAANGGCAEISRQYQVSEGLIRQVRQRTIWRNVA